MSEEELKIKKKLLKVLQDYAEIIGFPDIDCTDLIPVITQLIGLLGKYIKI